MKLKLLIIFLGGILKKWVAIVHIRHYYSWRLKYLDFWSLGTLNFDGKFLWFCYTHFVNELHIIIKLARKKRDINDFIKNNVLKKSSKNRRILEN